MAPSSAISNTELEVLKELWTDRTASVRTIHERLEARGKTWAYNTVQTLLNRLCDKGYVRAERSGRAVDYTVVATREDLVREELEGIAAKICDGASAPLVLSLFEGKRFSAGEIDEFKKLLARLEADAGEERGG